MPPPGAIAPPLVIEVLSPSNKEDEMQRQRVAAFSGGTREFWVIDLDGQSIEVSIPGSATRRFGLGGTVSVSVLPGVLFPVSVLFPR